MPIHSVEDAMHEFKSGGSKHIKSRAQAIAVGLKAEGKSKPPSARKKAQQAAFSNAKKRVGSKE